MLGTFLFAQSLHDGLQVAKVAGARNNWPEQGLSNGVVIFYDADFRESSEAVGLSQVRKMLRQLTGKNSAHYSTSKIKNSHLHLFRPDQGPHTVVKKGMTKNGFRSRDL